MANLSKIKRDEMLAFLDELRKTHTDDVSIRAFSMIENHLREKKYGLVWEEHSEEVDDLLRDNIPVLTADPERRLCKDENLPWSFIIEGDNLQALYLLEKTHRGKVDCIYIDPPYNSGAHDWKYNNKFVDETDNYRHSKWLSMIRNRLLLAKRLLNPDCSILICTIDEKEYLHLGCLLEEMFPEASIQMVSSVINRAGTGRKYEFSRTDEYIFYLRFGTAVISSDSINTIGQPVVWDTLRRSGPTNTWNKTKNQFYPIFVDDNTKTVHSIGTPLIYGRDRMEDIIAPEGCTAVFPIRDNGLAMMWGCVGEEFLSRLEQGYIRVGKHTPTKPQKYVISYLTSGIISDIANGKAVVRDRFKDGSVDAYYIDNREIPPTTNWQKPTHDAQWYGSNLIKPMLGNRFPYPKSLYAVRDSLDYCDCIRKNKDAIILDFFAGSGTTFHAVNLLNAVDGGHRRCIMVTNNEISEDDEERYAIQHYGNEDLVRWDKKPTQKNAKYIIDYSREEFKAFKDFYGISKYVTWPRTVCAINGCDINGDALEGSYGAEIEAYEQDDKSIVVSKSTGKPIKGTVYRKVKAQAYPELDRIKKSDGFNANVKYFKCDWTPRKPEEYLLSNALCLHIREMIELQNAIEIDNVKNCLILNRTDFKNIILNPEVYNAIENLWVNQNILFDAEELKLLEAKGYRIIPREFFGQELREVAE